MKSLFQADVYQRAMDHLFEGHNGSPRSLINFQIAGKLSPIQPTQKAQDWADTALEGAQLKAAYANVPLSGLLLLRDNLVSQFVN